MDCTKETFFSIEDPATIKSQANRIKNITDAKYKKANLSEVVQEATHLNLEEKSILYDLLKTRKAVRWYVRKMERRAILSRVKRRR